MLLLQWLTLSYIALGYPCSEPICKFLLKDVVPSWVKIICLRPKHLVNIITFIFILITAPFQNARYNLLSPILILVTRLSNVIGNLSYSSTTHLQEVL